MKKNMYNTYITWKHGICSRCLNVRDYLFLLRLLTSTFFQNLLHMIEQERRSCGEKEVLFKVEKRERGHTWVEKED